MAQKTTGNKSPKSSKAKQPKVDVGFKLQDIRPLTDHQKDVFEEYFRGQHLVIHGAPGTGKTFMALYLALKDILDKDIEQHQILIVRSAVSVRDQGFLPGTIEEKQEVYEVPYAGICKELLGRGDAYQILKQKNIIQFCTTSYLRGLTFDNTIVIVDEVQNMNKEEISTIVTRLGKHSRIILCGDTLQCDLFNNGDKNKTGIGALLTLAHYIDDFSTIQMTVHDILRSDIVGKWIRAKLDLNIA
jgi:phosphate starvation-inducible protein PhoH